MEVSAREGIHIIPTILIIVVLIIIFSMIFKMISEHLIFVITRYTVNSPKFENLNEEIRIALLCDLHNKSYGENNKSLVDAIKEEKPDLILVAGDMVLAKYKKGYEHALELMEQLPQIAPVYACNGNHEQRMKDRPEVYGDFTPYKEHLLESGITFLENEVEHIFINGLNIKISGLELPILNYVRKRRKKITRKTIKTHIGVADDMGYQILLTHYPQPYNMYKTWGADLVLAGHLHGGMVRIPKWRGVLSPQWEWFPKYSGELTKEKNHAIIVSRGLGNHTVPIRLFNKAEVVIITLEKEEV
jgi:predicted MPP superfamily phosphohydrolase